MKVIKIGALESSGEQTFMDEISTWVPPHHVEGIAVISPNGPVAADAVILTPSGPVVVEIKTLLSKVEGCLTLPVNDEWCSSDGPLELCLSGNDINPVGQTQTYAKGLRNHLTKRTGLQQTWVDGLVVLVQPNTKKSVHIVGSKGTTSYPKSARGIEVTTLTRFGGNGPLRTCFRKRATSTWSAAEARTFLEAMGLSPTSSRFPTAEELEAEGFTVESHASDGTALADGTHVTPAAGTTLAGQQVGDGTQDIAEADDLDSIETEANAAIPSEDHDVEVESADDDDSADDSGWSDNTRIVPAQQRSAEADETRSVPTDDATRVDHEFTRSIPGTSPGPVTTGVPTTPEGFVRHSPPRRTEPSPSTPTSPPPVPPRATREAEWLPPSAPPQERIDTAWQPPARPPRGPLEPSVTGAQPAPRRPLRSRPFWGCLFKLSLVGMAIFVALAGLSWLINKMPGPGSSSGSAETLISTKSKNIVCHMTETETRCDINNVKYSMKSVPQKCGGSSNWGHTFVISEGKAARLECPAKRMLVTDKTTDQLDWGGSKTVGSTTCTSVPDGLTCTSGAHGFKLRQAKYDVW